MRGPYSEAKARGGLEPHSDDARRDERRRSTWWYKVRLDGVGYDDEAVTLMTWLRKAIDPYPKAID